MALFESRADYDRCLKEGSYVDEVVIVDSPRPAEFVMTMVNDRKNNWRLCKGFRRPDGKLQFTKRTYLDEAEIDFDKYEEYYNNVIKPAIQRSNELIKDKFPDVLFPD